MWNVKFKTKWAVENLRNLQEYVTDAKKEKLTNA